MVAGRDLNALLTVARVSQNTLRVRIGAMAESTADYAMVPRNHSVTLLVMVPVAAPAEVELVARTTLVDTDTGDELPDSTQAEVEKLLAAIAGRYGLGQHGTKDLQNLLRCAQANDQRAFRSLLAGTAGEGHESLRLAQSLWIELVNLLGGSQFASVRFELPGHGAAETLPSAFFDQTLVVIDSGRAGSETLVRNASFPEGARVEGTLALESAGQALSLPAESVVLDRETRTVRLAFPSLFALGLAGDAQIPANLRVLLRNGDEPAHAFDALYLPPPPANPTYSTPNPFGLPGAATPNAPQGIPR
jgi:hypothetical protein